MQEHQGAHTCIGALDVCPLVYLRADDRGLADRSALDARGRIAAELEVPVFLYSELATASDRRERAFFRRGGLPELTRGCNRELKPDRGPDEAHPTAGATLVTARPPLAAFNLLLDTRELEVGKQIAAGCARPAAGCPAWSRSSSRTGSRYSTNVHDPVAVPWGRDRGRGGAAPGAEWREPTSAELVGLVPQAALDGFPAELRVDRPGHRRACYRAAPRPTGLNSLPMARKRRRRKHRRTQGGSIDRGRARAAPESPGGAGTPSLRRPCEDEPASAASGPGADVASAIQRGLLAARASSSC